MTRLKICGLTTYEDAACAAEAGADALGFVFADSPRRIDPLHAWEILTALGPFVTGVGVFVDLPLPEVRALLDLTGCTVAQLHGHEPPADIDLLSPCPVIKAVRVTGALQEEELTPYRAARALLLDSYVPGKAGGTGQRFDPSIAADLVARGWRVIIAGGLTPDNVAEVVQTVRPYGVDVSSGVESAPGRKDHAKLQDFVAAVRSLSGTVTELPNSPSLPYADHSNSVAVPERPEPPHAKG